MLLQMQYRNSLKVINKAKWMPHKKWMEGLSCKVGLKLVHDPPST